MAIQLFLNKLPIELEPIREVASRLSTGSNEIKDDAFSLSHRPHVAPLAYAINLFRPLSQAALVKYQNIHGITLSPYYLPILAALNGAHIFEFSLFGVPPSMASDPPLLNRSSTQPYDVATANENWLHEYAVSKDNFHFGGGPFSYDANCGYFFAPNGTIFSALKNGKELKTWSSFQSFLTDELQRAEAAYPAHEQFMSNLIRSSKPWWQKLWRR